MSGKKTGAIITFFLIILVIILIFVLILGNSNQQKPISTNPVSTASNSSQISVTNQMSVPTKSEQSDTQATDSTDTPSYRSYSFRNEKLLNQHYEKHGKDMGFKSAEEYEKAAEAVINNPNALHKIEAEDGDDIYYVESSNEFVVVSTDGYIRTYFYPDKGIDYFNRQ